jgi:hypothetical protein
VSATPHWPSEAASLLSTQTDTWQRLQIYPPALRALAFTHRSFERSGRASTDNHVSMMSTGVASKVSRSVSSLWSTKQSAAYNALAHADLERNVPNASSP